MVLLTLLCVVDGKVVYGEWVAMGRWSGPGEPDPVC